MADWWNSIQKGAQEAAETTKLVSMRTKLQAEVMYVENQVKTCLQKFGVEVFPHMENNNSAQVQQHFEEIKLLQDESAAAGDYGSLNDLGPALPAVAEDKSTCCSCTVQ